MFKLQCIEIKIPTLVFISCLDLLLIIILLIHSDNLNMDTIKINMYIDCIFLTLAIVSLIILRKQKERQQQLIDLILYLFFMSKCLYEIPVTKNFIQSFFGTLYLCTYKQLFSQLFNFNEFKIVNSISFAIFQVYSIFMEKQKNEILQAFQILFIVIISFNESFLHFSQNQTVKLFKQKYNQVNFEHQLIQQSIAQQNLGLLVLDNKSQVAYKNEHFYQIEQLFDSQGFCENIIYNPLSASNIRLFDKHNNEKIQILDDLKITHYSYLDNQIFKRNITLRDMMICKNEKLGFDESLYTLKLIDQAFIKYKYQVKYLQLGIDEQECHVFLFKQINDILFHNQAKKEQKFRNNLLSSFSHKLKTPLGSVLTHLEACINDINVDDQIIKQYIKPSYFNSKLQLYLIQDVLDYIQLYSYQKQNLEIKIVNIGNLLLEIKDLIITQCNLKGIIFSIIINGTEYEIYQEQKHEQIVIQTDRNKLIRILINLLNNAYRYTQQGGKICLKIDTIFVNSIKKLLFQIQDNGIGLSPKVSQEISRQCQLYQITQTSRKQSQQYQSFSERTRISQQTTNTKNDILGISLKITMNLINQLNNECDFHAESQPNGSNFTFTIGDIDFCQSQQSIFSQRKINKYQAHQSVNVLQEIKEIQFQEKISSQLIESERAVADEIKFIERVNPSKQKLKNQSHFKIQSVQHINKNKGIIQTQTSITKNKIHQKINNENNLIIIVDDEPFNHISLELMLKSLGFIELLHCYNGQEAIDMVQTIKQQQQIQAILMDIDMPIMDGLTASKILVDLINEKILKPFKIIACTAHEDEETRDKCFEVGIDFLVVKPVFPSILQQALQTKSDFQ